MAEGGIVWVGVWLAEILGGLFLSLVFWSLLLPLTLLLLLPTRWMVQVALNLRHGKGRFILASGIDAVFAHDQTPGSSSAPHMVLVQKGVAPHISVIRDRFVHHVFTHSDEGVAIYGDRLRSRFIANKWGWPVWERISGHDFDIRNHVKVLENSETVTLTEDQLLCRMGQFMQESSVQGVGRPQWEFLLVPNYVPRGQHQGQHQGQGQNDPHFACLVRLHHAYGDGASFLLLLDKALGDGPIHWTLDPMRPHPLAPPSSRWIRVLEAKVLFFGVLQFLRTLTSAMRDDSPFIFPSGGYSGGKVLGWSEPLPLQWFKGVASASGTAFSSIILTAFCGALRKLHLRKGHAHSGHFQKSGPAPWLNVGVVSAMIPFKHSRLQNSFSMNCVPCALREPDVAARLDLTHRSLRGVCQSGEPIFNYFVMRFTGLLPRRVMDPFLSLAGTPALFSNIPGPTRPISLFGKEVVDMGGWLPLIKIYGFGLTAMSTCGVVRLCLSSDSSLFPSSGELDRFMGEMEEELEMLGKIYGVPDAPGGGGVKGRRKRVQDIGDRRTTA